MTFGRVFFTIAGLALTACGTENASPAFNEEEIVDSIEFGPLGAPSEVVRAVNGSGYGNSPYERSSFPPPLYNSTGNLIEHSDFAEATPNNSGVYIYGSDANAIDELRFKFNVNSPSLKSSSKADFVQHVAKVLTRSTDLTDARVAELLAEESGEQIAVSEGIELTIVRQDHRRPSEGAHSIIYIFHVPGVKLQDS